MLIFIKGNEFNQLKRNFHFDVVHFFPFAYDCVDWHHFDMSIQKAIGKHNLHAEKKERKPNQG